MQLFSYLCIVKRIIITYGGYFEHFLASLSEDKIKKLN